MFGKILKWSVLTATVLGLVAFRGDIARYAKMKSM
jgi:hypothetical protein